MGGNKVTHTLIEPGIIKMTVEADSFLDTEDVEQMRQVNMGLSKGQRFSILLDTRPGYFTMGPEALRMLSSNEYLEFRKATAIVVGSLATRLAGNFFKSINPSKSPTRLFNSEEEAVKWLRKFQG